VSSKASYKKIEGMYEIMKGTLKYIKEVVAFMNFDTENEKNMKIPSHQTINIDNAIG
jgi:hypothetical protein